LTTTANIQAQKTTEIPPPDDEVIRETPQFGWLTVEFTLYVIVFVVAVALRFWQLGRYPLSSVEAGHALAALSLLRGGPVEATAYSPLLVSLQGLVFLLLGHSDTTARVIPALLGSTLALMPALFRRQLGFKISLVASAILAISPTASFLSRTLAGETATALGALMLMAGFFNWAVNGRTGWLYLLAAGLAILLTSGPMAYATLLIFALIVPARWSIFKALWTRAVTESASAPSADTRRLGPFQQAGLFFAALLLILATAGTLNLGGFGVTTSLLSDWLSRFSLQPRPDGGFNAIFLLTMYDPLLLVAGLAGVALAILSQNVIRQSMAGWLAGALLIDLAMGGRPNGAVMLAVTPLAFLAAFALAELWESLEQHGQWGSEGVILAAGLVIAVFGYIGLTGWLVRPCAAEDTMCNLAWLQPLAALVLLAVIVGFFWLMNGPTAALRGAAVTGVVIGLIVSVNITWRLNYAPLLRLPFQPLAGIPAATGLVDLTRTLAIEAINRAGDKDMLAVSLVGDAAEPALLWQLRAYKNLSLVASALEAAGSEAIITPSEQDTEFNLGEAFVGQDFGLQAVWSPLLPSPQELFNWLIYRTAAEPIPHKKVVLWLRWGNNG
jgi:uncharacterized protein (TIGR03663 family)